MKHSPFRSDSSRSYPPFYSVIPGNDEGGGVDTTAGLRAPWARAVAAAALMCVVASAAQAEKIFVSNEKDNTITVLDGGSLAIVKTVKVGELPRALLTSVDGKTIYICASDSDSIQALDVASLAVTRTLESGADPERFGSSPDGKTL